MMNLFRPKTRQPDATQSDFISSVAAEAVEIQEDSLLFPGAALLPISLRGSGVPGMNERPWSRLNADLFYGGSLPAVYSLTLQRQLPDVMRQSLRAKRTLFEGLLMAAAEKTGRRPSMAEQAQDAAMDAAESQIAMGKPAYKAAILCGLYTQRDHIQRAETARRTLESALRGRGFIPQRLVYIAERALLSLQPGGILFPGLDEPTLLLEEAAGLMPKPALGVSPADDSVWLGRHARDGRDVYYSFTRGFDPAAEPPPHATTLILGEMGSGKTSLMRWILLQRLLQGRTVVTLDPEGENTQLCQKLGGKVIPAGIPADPDTCLFHPLAADDPGEMLLAVRFLLAALAGEGALTPGVQAALHEAVKRRWERRPNSMTISELVEALGVLNLPEASLPIALLRPYMSGGLFEGFFDRPKALLSPHFPPGQWWSFDLTSLREENRNIVYAVLSWFLFQAVTVGRIPMDIFIDEGWRLLRSGPFADLLDELGRRARKRGIGVTLITHLPTDLAKQATSLSMAATAFIGRMGPEEAFHFFRSMGIPESEARRNAEQVSRLPARVFLAAPAGGRSALFPLQVTIPPGWLQLWKATGAAR